MNRFYGRSHSFGIGLGPAKVAGQPLKKIVDVLALEELAIVWLRFQLLVGLQSAIGRVWIVWAQGTLSRYCRRIRALTDSESYERLGVCGNAVTERGSITPVVNGMQHNLIFVRATTVQDKCAMHVSVGPDNKAYAHAQIVILHSQQGIRREQGLWRANVSTFRQCQRLRYRSKLRHVRGHTAQVLFQL